MTGSEPSQPFQPAEGVHVLPLRTPTLPPATRTNCVVLEVDDRRGVHVIDPASPWPEPRGELDAWLEERSFEVRAILLTHHHHDHVAGAAYLSERTGAPVWAHRRTGERVELEVARTLEDGERVGRLTAIFTPGHAPGHLAFRDGPTGMVVAGDMVAGFGTIVVAPPDGHMGTYLASLRRLKREAPTSMIPSHGPLVEAPQALLDEYIRHRLWREERVFEGLPANGGDTEIMAVTRAAYADAPASLHALAALSARAHLDHLVEQGRAVRVGDSEVWRRALPSD